MDKLGYMKVESFRIADETEENEKENYQLEGNICQLFIRQNVLCYLIEHVRTSKLNCRKTSIIVKIG